MIKRSVPRPPTPARRIDDQHVVETVVWRFHSLGRPALAAGATAYGALIRAGRPYNSAMVASCHATRKQLREKHTQAPPP